MPLPLVASLGAAVIVQSIIAVVVRVVAALGIGWLVIEGVELGFDQLSILVKDSFGGIPSGMLGLIGLSGADRFISLVLSAYAASLVLKGVGGTIRKMVAR